MVKRRAPLVGRIPPPGAVRSYQWPTYLVTAPHGVPQRAGDAHPRLPYGLWHARRVGSLQTACGRSAVTWQFFWTLTFADAGPHACPDCLGAL